MISYRAKKIKAGIPGFVQAGVELGFSLSGKVGAGIPWTVCVPKGGIKKPKKTEKKPSDIKKRLKKVKGAVPAVLKKETGKSRQIRKKVAAAVPKTKGAEYNKKLTLKTTRAAINLLPIPAPLKEAEKAAVGQAAKQKWVKKAKAGLPKQQKGKKQSTDHIINKVYGALPKLIHVGPPAADQALQTGLALAAQKAPLPGKAGSGKQGAGKAEQGKDTIQQKNIRLAKQIQERWLNRNRNVEKGTVSVGACAYQRDAVKTADFLLQIQQDMAEEYPVLNWRGNFAKEVVKQFKKDYQKTEKTIGNFVSETDIPFVSDFYGEFCGVRKKGEKSTAASKLGAFCRGFVVKGAGGTAEGIVKIVMDPLEVAAGVTQILAYPEENVPKIWKEAKRIWEQKAVKGSPEERRILEGQIVFEITSWFIGVGEAKTAAGASKSGTCSQIRQRSWISWVMGQKQWTSLGMGRK